LADLLHHYVKLIYVCNVCNQIKQTSIILEKAVGVVEQFKIC
jgi:hypothetical protein